jgi:hypothetical protein
MDTELAYLAGLFDGEGYIGIHRSGPRFTLRVSVTQLDPRPLILFQRRFGGGLHRAPDKRGFRALIVWTITSGRAMWLLREMRPFLMVKDAQADVAIEFQERVFAPSADRLEEIAERERLYQLCRDLKQRSYDHIELPSTPIITQDHKGKRLRWAKPKPPKKVRVKTAKPIRSTGYQRGKKPVDLANLYAQLGINELARGLGVSRQTVYNWLDAEGIPRQGRTPESEQRRVAALQRSWRHVHDET